MRNLSLLLLTFACGGTMPDPNVDDLNTDADGTAKMDTDAGQHDDAGMPPATCTAGAYGCRGNLIVECQADGLLDNARVITGCTDAELNTCGVCPGDSAPSCIASTPGLEGTIAGVPPAPIVLSENGCSDLVYSVTYRRDTHALVVYVPDMPLTVSADLGMISSGVSFPMYGPTPHTVVNVKNYTIDFNPPYWGSAKVTWAGVAVGDSVHLELEGPVTHDRGQNWVDIHVDLTAKITEVQ